VFRGTGGFDTSLTACEDVDLCQRLRRRGHRLVADERLHSIHHGDPRTLRQLFASELWRGRDNLTVSLRGPLTLREIPSIAIPMIVLAAILVLPVATGAAAFGQAVPLAAALGLILMATAARALTLVRRRAAYTPRGVFQALTVAGAYDLARALALVARKSHRRA
jgi:hypothetical protein